MLAARLMLQLEYDTGAFYILDHIDILSDTLP